MNQLLLNCCIKFAKSNIFDRTNASEKSTIRTLLSTRLCIAVITLVAIGPPIMSLQNVYGQSRPIHFQQQFFYQLDNCRTNATCSDIKPISYILSIPTKNDTMISNYIGHAKHLIQKDATPFILPFP